MRLYCSNPHVFVVNRLAHTELISDYSELTSTTGVKGWYGQILIRVRIWRNAWFQSCRNKCKRDTASQVSEVSPAHLSRFLGPCAPMHHKLRCFYYFFWQLHCNGFRTLWSITGLTRVMAAPWVWGCRTLSWENSQIMSRNFKWGFSASWSFPFLSRNKLNHWLHCGVRFLGDGCLAPWHLV